VLYTTHSTKQHTPLPKAKQSKAKQQHQTK